MSDDGTTKQMLEYSNKAVDHTRKAKEVLDGIWTGRSGQSKNYKVSIKTGR